MYAPTWLNILVADLTELVERAKNDLKVQNDEFSNFPTDEDFAFVSRIMVLVGQDPAVWFRDNFSRPIGTRPAWTDRFLADWLAKQIEYAERCCRDGERIAAERAAGKVFHSLTSRPDRGV